MGPDDMEKEHLLHSEAVEEIKRLKEIFLEKNPSEPCGEAARFIMGRLFMTQEFIMDGLFTSISNGLSAVPLGIAFQ